MVRVRAFVPSSLSRIDVLCFVGVIQFQELEQYVLTLLYRQF